MTARQFCSVLVATMGIYLIAISIQAQLFTLEMQISWSGMQSSLAPDGSTETSPSTFVAYSSLASALIGAALVLGRNRIAVVIAPDAGVPAQDAPSITASALMAVGIALLGLWLFATGAEALIPHLMDSDFSFRDSYSQAPAFSAVVRMVIGGAAFWLGYRQVRALDDVYHDLYEDDA